MAEIERELQKFAKQARALADQVEKEGAEPSVRGSRGGFQTTVHVVTATPPTGLAENLREVARTIDAYLQARHDGRR
jgi:hypothetical protein